MFVSTTSGLQGPLSLGVGAGAEIGRFPRQERGRQRDATAATFRIIAGGENCILIPPVYSGRISEGKHDTAVHSLREGQTGRIIFTTCPANHKTVVEINHLKLPIHSNYDNLELSYFILLGERLIKHLSFVDILVKYFRCQRN